MIGLKLPSRKRSREEAEKPFWISFADLMTALMVLFLISVTVALFAITSRDGQHDKEIEACMIDFKKEAAKYPGVTVDIENRSVSFGDKARFVKKSSDISSTSAIQLRQFAPEVLRLADASCGKKLFRRVVVEGYTSSDGSYLFNLDLSLKRAHSVVCALLDDPKSEIGLDDDQKLRIRNLFMVGGYSSNAPKGTDEESRRVEFKLEFWALGEKNKVEKKNASLSSTSSKGTLAEQGLGTCQLTRHVIP